LELKQQIDEAASAVRRFTSLKPEVVLILGTGLGSLTKRMEVEHRIPYEAIPHFPSSTVDSHAGELLIGHLAGKSTVAMSGRFHGYEGYSARQVAFPVRVARALGARMLVVANAAGGLNPQFAAGDLMVITDHINMMGDNPLIGPNDDSLGPRFPDMSEPYSNELIALAETVALDRGIRLVRGVYLGCLGPSLETRAEYRFMRAIGADAVGMSTVPEVIVAVHAGLRVLGFSVITDECFPDALAPANVREIIEIAERTGSRLAEVVWGCLERMTL